MSTRVHFCVARWSYWTPPVPGAVADVPEVPPLLRRRASANGRAALRVAFDCVADVPAVPAVFCSRHGEVHRSVEMLDQLSRREPLSPTTFSLSVHNAPAAVFSIARGDKSPTSSISAEQDTLPNAVLEAVLRLDDGDEQVLLVAHDEELPAPFKRYADETDGSYALGMLLTKSTGPHFSLELSEGTEPPSATPQIPQVARFLQAQDRELILPAAPRQWTWRKDA